MKKTQKILGLPIISISDGMEVGKVKSIIINADKGAIDYIVVDSGIQIFSARVIPTENILGIGEYALTIENEGVITDISRIPAAINLLQKDIQVKGTKVLTKKGRLIGEIGDIYIDENNCCNITGLEFIADITQKKIRLIPRDSVITFGKNLVVVKEEVESTLLDTPAQLGSEEYTFETEKKNLTSTAEPERAGQTMPYDVKSSIVPAETENVVTDTGTQFYEQEAESVHETTAEEIAAIQEVSQNPASDLQPAEVLQTPAAESNAASLFEQRQRQYLNGRITTKTVIDSAGNVIISEGETITDKVIDEAKEKGKLIELVMNNRA